MMVAYSNETQQQNVNASSSYGGVDGSTGSQFTIGEGGSGAYHLTMNNAAQAASQLRIPQLEDREWKLRVRAAALEASIRSCSVPGLVGDDVNVLDFAKVLEQYLGGE